MWQNAWKSELYSARLPDGPLSVKIQIREILLSCSAAVQGATDAAAPLEVTPGRLVLLGCLALLGHASSPARNQPAIAYHLATEHAIMDGIAARPGRKCPIWHARDCGPAARGEVAGVLLAVLPRMPCGTELPHLEGISVRYGMLGSTGEKDARQSG